MTKKIKKILIVVKRSLYQKYVLNNKRHHMADLHRQKHLSTKEIEVSYEEHNQTIALVKSVLKKNGIKADYLRRRYVGSSIKYRLDNYDLILTLGGDGTFLKVSHFLENQLILGVNSAPSVSVGAHCSILGHDFEEKFQAFLAGKFKTKNLRRLSVSVNGDDLGVLALNDVLFANTVPAAMSRYLIQVGHSVEDQKSSGVWVSTASGSTAAIRAAGGQVLPLESSDFQYLVREPYMGPKNSYTLTGDVLGSRKKIVFINKMIESALYIDGVQDIFNLKYGDRIVITPSSKVLKVVC